VNQAVEVSFDCVPLRSLARLDVPLDASPEYRALRQRMKHALEKHGPQHTYYLCHAHAVFHLVNSEVIGMLRFQFEGTATTDAGDRTTEDLDLNVQLAGHTCEWLTAESEHWFHETVRRCVAAEFDRYISSGELRKIIQRQSESSTHPIAADDQGMFV
jgi:hypothetical protein